MFGIDDMLLFSLLGAGTGALTNKKDPLKGALLGGGLGAAGGGLLGGGLAVGGEQGAMLAAQNAGLEGATAATNAALGGPGLLGQATAAMKPIGTAMSAAQTAQSMMPQEQPPIQPQPIQRTPMDMSAIFQNQGQQQQFEQAEQERRRQLMAQYSQGIGRGF